MRERERERESYFLLNIFLYFPYLVLSLGDMREREMWFEIEVRIPIRSLSELS